MLPVQIPLFDFTPDLRVLGFTLLIALLTGLLFGLAPVLQAWRTDVNSGLRESVRTGAGRHTGRLRQSLVVGEVAITAILVVAAALLMQSLFGLQRVEPGFEPRNLLTMQMSVVGPRYEDPRIAADLYRRAAERLVAVPGIDAAATATSLPLERGPDFAFVVEDRAVEGVAQWRAITPAYFTTLRIRLLRGRLFADTDAAASSPVVIVNEALARKYWPGRDPIGERITIGRHQKVGDPSRQIVGVVSDVKEASLDAGSPEILYLPTAQVPPRVAVMINALLPVNWIIRTRGNPLASTEQVKAELRNLEPDLPVSNVRTMDQVVGQSLVIQSASAWLLGIFAVLAVVLAVTGVYGVMSYSVAIRTQELAVRLALGAGTGDIARAVLQQALKVAGLGLAIGLAGAALLTQGMRGLLFGVAATNPLAYVTTAVVMTLVCLLSGWIPARRAMQVDPNQALRST
jgi:predicted permease